MYSNSVGSDEDYFRCVQAGYAPAQVVFLTREEALAARYGEEAKIAPLV